MRKLMFVTALVASVAAFADPITAINFEGYTVGSTVGNFETDTPDVVGGDTTPRFVYDGTADDSTVKAYGQEGTLAAPAIRTAWFTTNATENLNYLDLSTGDGTLWRSINEAKHTTVDEQTTWSIGDPQTVGDGIYLDTLVQFTAWEDDAPTVDSENDKLAVWLSATNSDGVAETNLMVTAAVVGDQGGRTPTNFKLNTAAPIEAGKWYRLTIKAVRDITEGDGIAGFQIFLDGDMLTSSTPTLTDAYLELIDWHSTYADIVAGKYFASLQSEDTPSLKAVGFQGTGAVDDIVWTNEDPISQTPSVVEYTLTLTDGGNVTWGAVTYTIGGNEVSVNSGSKIPEDAVVSIASPTFASDYELDALTTNTVAVVGPTFPFTFTMTGDMTVAISAKKTETPVENPTVDGQTVEPANVFNTAASDKPITYPSAPTIAGKEGSQTIAFNGVTVSVPDYYTATLDGNVVSLALNTNALPVIADATIEGTVKNAIEVGATTFTTTLTSTNEKLYYGLKVATSPNAPDEDWTVSALTKGTGAAMQIQMDKPTVSENPASAGFFKVYVTDIAPAAGE